MILMTPTSVDSASEVVIKLGTRSGETRCTSIAAISGVQVVPVFVPSVPPRSVEFMQFAAEVAARLPVNPEFSEDWMNELVENFAQYDD